MATPPDQIPFLLHALVDHDVALGSRIQPDGSDMRATQPGYRRLLGKVFHVLASIWVTGPVQDTQCGFKGFRREAAQDLFARQVVTSIVFDVELIYLARRRGYRMAIVPIRWFDKRGSRMRAGPGLAAAGRVGPVPDPAHPSPSQRGAHGTGVMDRHALASPGADGAADRRRAVVRRRRRPRPWRSRATRSATTSWPITRPPSGCSTAQPLYDMSFTATGGFGLFYYPPTVRAADPPVRRCCRRTTATWVWIGLSLVGVPRRGRDPAGLAVRPLVDRAARRPVVPVRLRREARPGRADPVPGVRDRLALARRPGAPGRECRGRGRDQAPAGAHPGLGAPDPAVPGGRRRGSSCSSCSRWPRRSWPAPAPGSTS